MRIGPATWLQWNNLYYQYELGFLPEESWLGLRAVIKRNFERGTITVHAYSAQNSSPTFNKVVDQIIAEVESERSH